MKNQEYLFKKANKKTYATQQNKQSLTLIIQAVYLPSPGIDNLKPESYF